MRLALAQINPTIGDIAGNSALIAGYVERAREQRADIVVFPELALSGYPPKDLLLQEGFVKACADAAKTLGETHSHGITTAFGTPLPADRKNGTKGAGIANALLVYRDGKFVEYYDKRLLPTYDVFDEDRYFVPGERPVVLDVPSRHGPGMRVGLSICEDLWRGKDVGFSHRYLTQPDPVAELVNPPGGGAGAQVIVNPSASPFVLGKGQRHRELLRRHAVTNRVYLAAVNQVGGNDELVFDGHAAVFNPEGSLIAAGRGFEEDLVVIDLPRVSVETAKRYEGPGTGAVDVSMTSTGLAGMPDPVIGTSREETLFRALVLGVRDYCRKTGFKSAVLGLSGGIDSAVCCAIAAAALGPENVHGVSLPSRFSSEGSKSDAHELAENLGVGIQTIQIEPAFQALLASLAQPFGGRAPDVAEENLQSRVRGTILMGLSNKLGHIVLTTGNKSELAVGYCTLYGDMNGGLAVLSDVTKQWVYRLAHWMNANPEKLKITNLAGPPIPEASITKAPSAELRANQTDQDSLPPYDVLDEILERYVERREDPARIVKETGFDSATVARVVRLIDVSEYKRKQAAIGIKVTGVAFGSGRRYPIAQGYRPDRGLRPG